MQWSTLLGVGVSMRRLNTLKTLLLFSMIVDSDLYEFSLGKLNRDDVCRLPEKALGNLPWCLCSMLGKTDLLLSVGCNEP